MQYEPPVAEELLSTQLDIDYYAVLDLSPTATSDEIRERYIKLSKQYHPDKNKDPDASIKFAEVAEAANVLSSKILRSEYNRHRAINRPVCTKPTSGWGSDDFWSPPNAPPTKKNKPPRFVRPPSAVHDRLGTGRYDKYGWDAGITRHENALHPEEERELGWWEKENAIQYIMQKMKAEANESLKRDGYYGVANEYEQDGTD